MAQSSGVGEALADPADLARVFASVCVAPSSFAQAQGVLQGMGMLGNPETGTFFHQSFNMSVNPAGAECTMVFAAASTEEAAMAAFRDEFLVVAGQASDDFDLVSLGDEAAGYMRAGVEVDW